MKKKLYKIHFLDEGKNKNIVYANKVNPSSFLGLIELSDIVFLDTSEILITPDDDKIRKEFQDVERTFLPINAIIRIDEIVLENETPVIKLYKKE